MCDPLSIASAVATVGGTIMQSRAQAAAQRGIQSAIAANGAANDRLRAESRAGVEKSAGAFSREAFDKTQQDETAKVQTKLTDALSQGKLPGEYYGGKQSENTAKYTEQKTTQTNDFSKQMADALANLRGFGQGQIVNTTGVQRAGEVVGMNQNKEAGNNAILPIQIEAAKSKGYSPLGNLFTSLGAAGSMAGLAAGGGGMLKDIGGGLKSAAGGTGFGTGYDVSKMVRTNGGLIF